MSAMLMFGASPAKGVGNSWGNFCVLHLLSMEKKRIRWVELHGLGSIMRSIRDSAGRLILLDLMEMIKIGSRYGCAKWSTRNSRLDHRIS